VALCCSKAFVLIDFSSRISSQYTFFLLEDLYIHYLCINATLRCNSLLNLVSMQHMKETGNSKSILSVLLQEPIV
jgi:hypothetical protein